MSTVPQFTPTNYSPGDPLLATRLNAHEQETARQGRVSASPPASISSDGTGINISVPVGIDYKWGVITGHGTGDNANAYSWTEQRRKQDGSFEDMPNGMTGDATASPLKNPAYFSDGATDVANDTIVELRPDFAYVSGSTVVQEWMAERIGGGGESDVEVIKVTSTTPGDEGYLPGVLQSYDTATNTWSNGTAIWVLDINA